MRVLYNSPVHHVPARLSDACFKLMMCYSSCWQQQARKNKKINAPKTTSSHLKTFYKPTNNSHPALNFLNFFFSFISKGIINNKNKKKTRHRYTFIGWICAYDVFLFFFFFLVNSVSAEQCYSPLPFPLLVTCGLKSDIFDRLFFFLFFYTFCT